MDIKEEPGSSDESCDDMEPPIAMKESVFLTDVKDENSDMEETVVPKIETDNSIEFDDSIEGPNEETSQANCADETNILMDEDPESKEYSSTSTTTNEDVNQHSKLNSTETAEIKDQNVTTQNYEDKPKSKTRKYKCQYCHYTTQFKSSLKIHVECVHMKLKQQQCNFCDYKAYNMHKLNRHIDSIHKNVKGFRCSSCDYVANQKSHLKSHVEAIHIKLRHNCTFCDYSSSTKHNLKIHVNRRHTRFKYSLPDFSSSETNISKLAENSVLEPTNGLNSSEEHLGIHYLAAGLMAKAPTPKKRVREKKFQCEMCDYRAFLSSNLKRHVDAVHKKLREYKCSECDYSGNQKCHLQAHIDSIHKNIRKYHKCNLCDFTASRKHLIETHMHKNHMGVPYVTALENDPS